jgi:hypothetical protein
MGLYEWFILLASIWGMCEFVMTICAVLRVAARAARAAAAVARAAAAAAARAAFVAAAEAARGLRWGRLYLAAAAGRAPPPVPLRGGATAQLLGPVAPARAAAAAALALAAEEGPVSAALLPPAGWRVRLGTDLICLAPDPGVGPGALRITAADREIVVRGSYTLDALHRDLQRARG